MSGIVNAAGIVATDSSGKITDTTAAPGNATINGLKGRVAIAIAAASVVVTNNQIAANSVVLPIINQAATDATLTDIIRVQVAAGSVTITGNAAATAAVFVDFIVIQ